MYVLVQVQENSKKRSATLTGSLTVSISHIYEYFIKSHQFISSSREPHEAMMSFIEVTLCTRLSDYLSSRATYHSNVPFQSVLVWGYSYKAGSRTKGLFSRELHLKSAPFNAHCFLEVYVGYEHLGLECVSNTHMRSFLPSYEIEGSHTNL